MELMMFNGNDYIDSVRIEKAFILFPGYTSHFVRLLKQRNERLLSQLKTEPEFLFYNYSFDIPAPVFEMIDEYSGCDNAEGYRLAI